MTNNNALAVRSFINNEATQARIVKMLDKKAQQFTTSLLSAVNANDKLAECEPATILNAAMTAASLDLPINQNLGVAYLVPYDNRKAGVKECQFQMGYKGFIQLAQRSGLYKTINADVVYEGELVGFNKLSGEVDLTGEKTSDEVIGYFAYFKLLNGFEKIFYMPREQAEAHASKYSQSYKSPKQWIKEKSLWSTDFDMMAIKTVIKLLISKYGPMSTELQKAVVSDQAIITGDGEVHYVDNDHSKPELSDEEKKQIKAEAGSIADQLEQEAADEQQ